MAEPWTAQQESRLRERRGYDRLRAECAGPDHDLVFTDRVIVTLVVLRFQLPHAALALLYQVDRSTITRAVGEIRPLLAARGFAVPGKPGLRLRTLADVFAYAATEGVQLRIDGTEVRVRRPKAGRPGRRAFVSGKKKQTPASPPASAYRGGQGRNPVRDGLPKRRVKWLGVTRSRAGRGVPPPIPGNRPGCVREYHHTVRFVLESPRTIAGSSPGRSAVRHGRHDDRGCYGRYARRTPEPARSTEEEQWSTTSSWVPDRQAVCWRTGCRRIRA